ncbi:MAG: TIGR04282 family arsenosugar biosynthesis glycosyltransferase [Acidobacteriota bacterium]
MPHPSPESEIPSAAVAVFARAPVPGATKTRLIPRLGSVGAARLQAALLRRSVQTALAANLGQVFLWCEPDCKHPVFQECREEFGVALMQQQGDDLGARMFDAFAQLCVHGHVLLMGTDCPALTAAELRAAAGALIAGADAAFVPAQDGGYVLVGLSKAVASLFEGMPWGSSRVMTETRARLDAAGMRWLELPASWDIDLPDDFDRLLKSGLMAGCVEAIARECNDAGIGEQRMMDASN